MPPGHRGGEPLGLLLIVAPYPPATGPAGAAGIRARSMARGLRARGHEVTVICAGPAAAARVDDGVRIVPARYLDVEAHARRIGVELRELRTEARDGRFGRTGLAREIAVRLCVPDRYVIWVPAAIAAARRAGAHARVVISGGPVSAHLVARAVVGDRPWLVDCNDLWSRNPDRTNGRLRDAVDEQLEQRILRRATCLTTVSDPMRDELERRHAKPVTVLYSGFDPAEFPDAPPRRADDPRRLLFAGTLYGKQDLTPLLRALADGRRDGWLSPDRLVVSFIGRLSDRAALEAERFGVAAFVRTSEPIPRADLLHRLVEADALLLPSLYETDRNALPMKLFEYVGAGRPIIVFGNSDHLAARLVADNKLGVVLPDAPTLARCLRDVAAGTHGLPVADAAARARFGRETSLRTLGALVDAL